MRFKIKKKKSYKFAMSLFIIEIHFSGGKTELYKARAAEKKECHTRLPECISKEDRKHQQA